MSLISRRDFLYRTLTASSATALFAPRALRGSGEEDSSLPIVVFSKVYQSLKLNFDEAAALTAEAGLNGVDCPVRPGGEILPEHATAQLPEYVAALKKRGLQMPLLTTGITSVTSPHAEEILRAAKRVGVQYYRLGFVVRDPAAPAGKQVREMRARLAELAPLNRQIGIGALLQNHSPSGKSYLGGDLADMYELVEGFDPSEVGIAFDIGHALVVHGDDWRRHFDRLKAHLKIAYIKDVTRAGRWVPFGQGDIAATGYFKLLKQINYRAPVCLHVEFDWSDGGRNKTRGALLKALQESARTLRSWLSAAG